MDERRLVKAFHGLADGGDVAYATTAIKYRLAKTRPQFLAAAPQEIQCYVGYAHLPNTSISM